jgi:hypothetical protein
LRVHDLQNLLATEMDNVCRVIIPTYGKAYGMSAVPSINIGLSDRTEYNEFGFVTVFVTIKRCRRLRMEEEKRFSHSET